MQDDMMFAAWQEGEDPEAAVRLARETAADVVASDDLIDVKIGLLEGAAEALLDGPGGNPMLVVQTAKKLVSQNMFLERNSRASAEVRMRRRVKLAKLQARGLHCAGEHYLAFRAVLAAYTTIENVAGGRTALLSSMANRPPNVCAECMVEILGIGAASLRKSGVAQESLRSWTLRFAEIVRHYIPKLSDPKSAYIYPSTDSMVQMLYLLAEQRDPADADLVRALHGLDKLARATHRRALATVPLREVAVAGFEGDEQRAATEKELVLPRLRAHPLPRHLRIVGQYL